MPECPECGRHVGVLLEDGWCIWCDGERDTKTCPVCGRAHNHPGEFCAYCNNEIVWHLDHDWSHP